ncbi:MAG TPA: hypothetical protein VG897_07950 [Terriglobales bacterium]|nr:hypothetical protein [Terriglobales bacterium]
MATDGYKRSMIVVDDRLLIRSICIECGHEIVNSVTDKLAELETTHRESCPLGSEAQACD